ncbi:MAG: glycosyltransferase [Paramuribaculum sp.]|nr:glycosyltransferase [Paramuribaculum sp.]
MENFYEMWSFDFTPFTYLAGGVALIAQIVLLAVQLQYIRKVANVAIRQRWLIEHDANDCEPVSVIVYAHSDAWNLPVLIPAIFSQDYKGDIEVVVVNDVAYDNTEDVVKELMMTYPALRYTFAPAASRNLSRKKLAITLGIKAASHDVLLFTGGNCRVPSDSWLSRMMRHVASGKDVVIGYATLRDHDGDPGTGLSSRLMSFDMIGDSVKYLTAALSGRPYRGNGNNLIYRRRMFFENKGFARSLNLTYGDDDIMISEIATADNTAVELSADAILEAREDRPGVMYELDRIHHNFTSGFLSRTPRVVAGMMSLCWWLWVAGIAVMCWLGAPSLVPVAASVVMACGLWIPFMISWRRTCVELKAPHAACVTVPFMMLWHPIYNLRLKIKGFRARRDNYTWSK